MRVSQLTCFACGKSYPADEPIGLCACGKPLRVDLALQPLLREEVDFDSMAGLGPVLPLAEDFAYQTLGEGGTPLLPAPSIGPNVWIKEEGVNPTGSFKARGMAMAVYQAARFGMKKLAVPSAGNAGGALAAYAALYGLEAHVFMPRDVPMANRLECELFGAHVTLVDGLITDCAKLVIEGREREGWFDVSTLKEPYRIEGKKTMGYEIAAQLGWRYPDVIIYPTGGGTGLIGMWKAFDEMEAMGWIEGRRPRMYSVQAEGCAPIVRQWNDRGPTPFEQNRGDSAAMPSMRAGGMAGAGGGHPFLKSTREEPPHTIAAGLRVPKALGDFIILDILEKSGGAAVAVSDRDLMAAARRLSRETGICAAPEGGATLAAYEAMRRSGELKEEETAVLFNTGTGLKYAEAFAAFPPA